MNPSAKTKRVSSDWAEVWLTHGKRVSIFLVLKGFITWCSIAGVSRRMHASVAVAGRRIFVEEGRRWHPRRVRDQHLQDGLLLLHRQQRRRKVSVRCVVLGLHAFNMSNMVTFIISFLSAALNHHFLPLWKAALLNPVPLTIKALVDGQWGTSFFLFIP